MTSALDVETTVRYRGRHRRGPDCEIPTGRVAFRGGTVRVPCSYSRGHSGPCRPFLTFGPDVVVAPAQKDLP